MSSKNSKANGDRLSDLPDPILHHILSFLDAKYAVRTCILSSRWKNLWKSLPHLTFNKTISTPHNDHFVDLVNCVLIARDASDIQTFRLLGVDYSDSPHLWEWILGAIARNVREFDFMAAFTTVSAPFKLPNALFNCQTLTSLRLSLNENTSFPVYLPLHWPSSISLPNLKVLRLFRVSFRDLYAASKFILSCPSLLTLELLHCSFDGRGCFCIGSPSLKFLTIQTPVHLTSPDDSFVIIGVLAPNLKYLLFDADMRMGFLFVKARTHLVRAAINMELFKGTRSLLPLDDLPFTDKLKKVLVRYVTNIIGAVHLTEDLTLSPWTLQVAFESRIARQGLSLKFPNLKRLKLRTRFSRQCAISIMYLLKTTPKIETLTMEIVENTFSWEPLILDENKSTATHVGDWWNSELSNECMLHHLKDVEISGIVGCLAEVKLLQVVLKRATILQRMVLRTSAESTIENKLLKGLSKMLLELPRASSNVALVLV